MSTSNVITHNWRVMRDHLRSAAITLLREVLLIVLLSITVLKQFSSKTSNTWLRPMILLATSLCAALKLVPWKGTARSRISEEKSCKRPTNNDARTQDRYLDRSFCGTP